MLQQRIAFEFGESGIAVRVGAVEPLEGAINVTAEGVDLGDLKSPDVLKTLDVVGLTRGSNWRSAEEAP